MSQHYDIARDLLAIKAVQIETENYFTWTSGIKSPIYCDNRLTMSYPEVRKRIIDGFINKIKTFDVQPDVIAGCATDRKSTRLNSSHVAISYAVFCLKKKTNRNRAAQVIR